MTEETLTDLERRRLLQLALYAVPINNTDPELTRIIAKLSGVDTVIVVRRAYPAAGKKTETDERPQESDNARGNHG